MMATNPTRSKVESFRQNLSILWQGLQNHKQGQLLPQEQRQESDAIQQKEMLVKEAIRAAMAWTILYVGFFVLLLGYKWQTKGYYAAEYQRKLALIQEPTSNAIETPWWIQQQAELDRALAGIREFARLQSVELRKVDQQKEMLEQLTLALEQLDEKPSSTNNQSSPFPFEGKKVESLLQYASLADIQTSTNLQDTFEDAAQELKKLLQTPEQWDWALVQEKLSASLSPKQPSTASEAVTTLCSGSNDNTIIEPDNDSSILTNAARQSDLEEQIQVIKSYLEKREGGNNEFSRLLLPDTLASLERAMKQRIHVILEMIIASSGRPGTANGKRASASSCLSSDDVVDIVEEGLLALQQGVSLRNVMRKKIVELDPSVKSIILDADLTPPTPKIPPRETTNLRRLLETPLLLQLGSGIDLLVEMAGGHNDHLDQWLDSVAGGRESVGDMVVRRILEVSGKAEIPSFTKLAKQYLPVKAQTFSKK